MPDSSTGPLILSVVTALVVIALVLGDRARGGHRDTGGERDQDPYL